MSTQTIGLNWIVKHLLPMHQKRFAILFFLVLGMGAAVAQRPSSDTLIEIHEQYDLLGKWSLKLDSIILRGGWPAVNGIKKPIRPGQYAANIPQIRERLLAGSKDTSTKYDNHLETIVRSFQYCHGIEVDGIIGPATLREMNVPATKRRQQLQVNQERSKWMRHLVDDGHFIVVNIPAFQLYGRFGDSLNLNCRVVVGKETDKTAIFRGIMRQVVFNPYWYIPNSIYEKEIKPKVLNDPSFLEKNEMEWFNGQLRQEPGDRNPLGKVKFLFPNGYNIYLHDTPSKQLFGSLKRTFSHGCIRVSSPEKLAALLLHGQDNWDLISVREAMRGEKERFVSLEKTVPVYIVYLTSFVDGGGELHFRKDVYRKDTKTF